MLALMLKYLEFDGMIFLKKADSILFCYSPHKFRDMLT